LLLKQHLHDWPRLAAAIAADIKIDQLLSKLLVVGYDPSFHVLVSCKPSLQIALRKQHRRAPKQSADGGDDGAPSKRQDVTNSLPPVGEELPALWIRKVTSAGLVVCGTAPWQAFCHRNLISQEFIAPDAELPYAEGMTVVGRIRSATVSDDRAKKRQAIRVACGRDAQPKDLGLMVQGYLQLMARRVPQGLQPGAHVKVA
jgi:hypothetical protein